MKEYSPVTLVLNGEALDTSRQVSVASLKQAAGILTASVVHDSGTRDVSYWAEPDCGNRTETECEALRCPVTGWRWSPRERRCERLQGYTCCFTCSAHQYQCFPPSQASQVKCCAITGVVPSAYKNTCHQGFIWVAWKRLCVRKN